MCILAFLANATKTKRSWIDSWDVPLPPPYALRPHLRSGLSTWWAAPWADHVLPLVPGPALHDIPHIIDPPSIPFAPVPLTPLLEHGQAHGHHTAYVYWKFQWTIVSAFLYTFSIFLLFS